MEKPQAFSILNGRAPDIVSTGLAEHHLRQLALFTVEVLINLSPPGETQFKETAPADKPAPPRKNSGVAVKR